jgi:glycosyltransferase involved in cell wall biosynthesis
MKISIVSPSFNQEAYLEEAMLSVLGQQCTDLEYIVIDGGSSDRSADIIRKHAHALSYWVSEPDGGQYHAINKGFALSSGEIMAWLNSDDKYMPWTLQLVEKIFGTFTEIQWLTTLYPVAWDERGMPIDCRFTGGFNPEAFFRGANLPLRKWYARHFIQQESTFWRRSLWEKAGGKLDNSMRLASDFELWCRFFELTDLYAVSVPLAGFRYHSDQRTALWMDEYLMEAEKALRSHNRPVYGKWETRFRTAAAKILAPQTVMKLPAFVHNILATAGILYPAKVCVYKTELRQWKINTDYFI